MSDTESASRLHAFYSALQGVGFGLVLVFMALVNLDLAHFYVGFTLLPVIGIFFWPLKGSYSWSIFFIFLLGLFHDLASNGPLGVWVLSYLLAFTILGGGVNLKPGLGRNLGGFILVLGLVMGMAFVFGLFSIGQMPNITNLLISALSTILVFPFVYWFRSIFGFARSGTNPLAEGGI